MPSLTWFTATTAILLAAASSVAALPGGAPKCAINPTVIGAAHQAPSAAGYKVSASAQTYKPGDKVTFTLEGTSAIHGVLMYATPATESDAAAATKATAHVGAFALPSDAFRPQTADICTAANIKNDAPESTITHANPAEKGTKVDFVWTAPASNVGPVTLNVAVTNGAPGKAWQVLDIVTLQPDGGAPAAPTAGGATTPTRPKCRVKPGSSPAPSGGSGSTQSSPSGSTNGTSPDGTVLSSASSYSAYALPIAGAAIALSYSLL